MSDSPKDTNTKIKHRNLQALIAETQKSPFWHEYQGEITQRFVQSMQAVMTNASGPESDLRVSAALMSAYHTVLNLPDIMLQQAEAAAALEAEGDEDGDRDRTE